jgi:hypothetical protein
LQGSVMVMQASTPDINFSLISNASESRIKAYLL